MLTPLLRLQCGCNSYDWGKKGSSSKAANLASATGFEVDESKPYAELWMGTHPSLPSKDLETGRSLLDLVKDNEALVGPEVAERYGQKLPFLFKVLSISKALSIQAHPNKKLAEQLHARDSKNYPDDNHKPEMTIALTDFTGLCGFRPLDQIAHFLRTVKPLRKLVGETAASDFEQKVKSDATEGGRKKVLKEAFSALMKNALDSGEALKTAANELVSEAQTAGSNFAEGGGPSPVDGAKLAEIIATLNGQFPSDIGLFVLFFLNYVELSPGEAMFLRADDIHAYLSGDIVECMASSDNVVRAGFTPKFKDVDTLTTMLTYNYAPIDEQKMKPTDYPYVTLDATAYSAGSTSIIYDPPIDEFSVVKTDLKAQGSKATFESLSGPSILLCTQGEGTINVGASKTEQVKEGYVFFIGATAECVLRSTGETPFQTFRAFCEIGNKADSVPQTNGST